MDTNGKNGRGSAKLEALRKKEADLKAAIAVEKVRQQRQAEKEEARLCSIIGAALVQKAAAHPDFESMLKSVLRSSTSPSDSDKKLLRAKGWY
jgi:hypothetical protein